MPASASILGQRSRSTFATPLTHGQSLSASERASLTWSTVDDH
jgi:hypothetical protein